MTWGSVAPGRNANEAETLADPNHSTITMILSEMGLKLEPTKTPLNLYVIEHVERPSAN
jgi:uncharacterized protein (TIGR03435 family)